jgi:uncharacterized protein YpiB (UPF0302 family)
MDYVNNTENNKEINDQYFENLIFEKIVYNPNLDNNKKDLTNKEKANKILDSIDIHEEDKLQESDKSLDNNDKQAFSTYK